MLVDACVKIVEAMLVQYSQTAQRIVHAVMSIIVKGIHTRSDNMRLTATLVIIMEHMASKPIRTMETTTAIMDTSITTTMQSTNMVKPPTLIHIRMEMMATLDIRMITVRTVCAA
jgi:hypothetical protein